MATQQAKDVPVMLLALKAPVELFEELDRWREQQIGKPSRPASIRWIVHQFLLQQKEERRTKRRKSR